MPLHHVFNTADTEGVALQDAAFEGAEPVEAHAEFHDIADDNDGGSLEFRTGDIFGGVAERRFEHRLILQRGVADKERTDGLLFLGVEQNCVANLPGGGGGLYKVS